MADVREDGVDVVVVGAGPGGAVAALRLARAGVRVVCLEQGGWPDRASYPGTDPTWELQAQRTWSSSPAVRRSAADYPVDGAASDMAVLNFNAVGGASLLYAAQWPRMLPEDLRVATVDGVADDWPVDYAELRPFYEETERQFGVSGLGGNPLFPPGADPPLPALPIGEMGLRVARAHHRLGWHWWPAANAIASAPHGRQHRCVRRGTCGVGCNEGAKGSVDVTHWPEALALGVELVTGARARRVVCGRDGLAEGVEWVDREGGVHLQRGDVVLLAANAVGTARLLLTSADATHPDGLANSSGLVGRRLMLHPVLSVGGVLPDVSGGWRSQNGALVQTQEFGRSDPSRGFVRGSCWGLQAVGGVLRTALAPDGRGVWGPGHHDHVDARLGRTCHWAVLCEDLPEEANRVVLDPGSPDGDGVPGVAVHYRLSENTRRMGAFMVERATESLTEAGASVVEPSGFLPNGHLMGTTRMGDDPSSSVVDRWGMCHDVPNLGVVDGGVFVTAGSANPTSTIAALSLRTAEHLVATRRWRRRPSGAGVGGRRRIASRRRRARPRCSPAPHPRTRPCRSPRPHPRLRARPRRAGSPGGGRRRDGAGHRRPAGTERGGSARAARRSCPRGATRPRRAAAPAPSPAPATSVPTPSSGSCSRTTARQPAPCARSSPPPTTRPPRCAPPWATTGRRRRRSLPPVTPTGGTRACSTTCWPPTEHSGDGPSGRSGRRHRDGQARGERHGGERVDVDRGAGERTGRRP